jgi:hypothetical protein
MGSTTKHFTAVALGALLVAGVPARNAAAADPVLRLDAVAVNMSGFGRTGAQTIEVVIERWSSDDEQKKIIDTLVEKKPSDLLDVVQDFKPRAGFIRTRTSLGWDIQFARIEELPGGGQKIFFLTDRPMSFFERANNTRSSEYEYLVCEVHLHADGKGEGKLESAAKVTYDKSSKVLEIEDYGTQPVRLTTVSVRK